jgi:uncharacterized membrane protein
MGRNCEKGATMSDPNKAYINVNVLHADSMTFGQRVADMVAAFVGSWLCVALHTVWFVLWFVFRLDIALLTNIVSLEAIFLCIFLLMSQNRQSDKDHIAQENDYHTNTAAKKEIETILARLEAQDTVMLAQHAVMLEHLQAIEVASKPVKPPLNVVKYKGAK